MPQRTSSSEPHTDAHTIVRNANVLEERKLVFDHASQQWRPVWRGRIHGITALLAIPAGLWLIWVAPTIVSTVAATVYVLSLFALLAASSGYHLFTRSPRTQIVARRLDHSMIYVLIAGTYTPVCLLAMPPKIGVPFLLTIWLTAITGVGLKVAWRAHKIGAALYLIIGWAVLVVFPWAYAHMGFVLTSLFAVGGLLYTVGAILFFLKVPALAPKVFGYHEVWHTFVVAAIIIQFVAVSGLILASG